MATKNIFLMLNEKVKIDPWVRVLNNFCSQLPNFSVFYIGLSRQQMQTEPFSN